jgi:hypothetical protein
MNAAPMAQEPQLISLYGELWLSKKHHWPLSTLGWKKIAMPQARDPDGNTICNQADWAHAQIKSLALRWSSTPAARDKTVQERDATVSRTDEK